MLLGLWLGFMATAFASLYAAPRPTDDPAAIVAWLRTSGALGERATGRPLAFRMPASTCACRDDDDDDEWSLARAALAEAATGVVDLQTGELRSDLPYELVVLDAGARLVYAGPLRLKGLCGGSDIGVARMLPGLLARSDTPFISASDCRC